MRNPAIIPATDKQHFTQEHPGGVWVLELKPVPNHSPRDDPAIAAKLWIRRAKANPATLDTLKKRTVWGCRVEDLKFYERVRDLLYPEGRGEEAHTTPTPTGVEVQEQPGPDAPGEVQTTPGNRGRLQVVYEPAGAAREYAALALNIYTGCDHGCGYCYSPGIMRQSRETFLQVQPRKDLLAKVRKDAKTLSEAGCSDYIHLCFSCDPYSHFDQEQQITREVIDILLSAGLKVQILTKGGKRGERDFDILQRYPDQVRYGVTLTFTDEGDRERWEPGAAPTHERIHALIRAFKCGFSTWVSIEPVIDPVQSLELIRLSAPHVSEFKIGKLNHNKTVESGINWAVFGKDAVELCEALKVRYALKEDLIEAMQQTPAPVTDPHTQGEDLTPAQVQPAPSTIPTQLQRRDLLFVPIPRGEKGPHIPGWNLVENGVRYDDPGLQAHLSRGGNYGYYPSPDSRIVNVDVDHATLFQQAGGEDLLRDTFTYGAHLDGHKYRGVVEVEDLPTHWKGRVSRIDSPGGERVLELFFPAGPITTSTRNEAGEIREETITRTGGQVVGPGSLHPNGNRYGIVNDSPIRCVKWGDIERVIEAINPSHARTQIPEKPRIFREQTGPGTRLLRERYSLEPPYPVNPRPAGNEIRGAHPFHDSTSGDNYALNIFKGVGYCFRHSVGYDATGWEAVSRGIIECGQPLTPEAFSELIRQLEDDFPEVSLREKLAYRERKRREREQAPVAGVEVGE